MIEYIIVGDTPRYEGCLVRVCGSDLENAEYILNQMLNNPTPTDLRLMEGHSNFRIKPVEEKYQWWNDRVMAN